MQWRLDKCELKPGRPQGERPGPHSSLKFALLYLLIEVSALVVVVYEAVLIVRQQAAQHVV